MSNELMKKVETSLQSSLKDLLKTDETPMLLIDTSGSMAETLLDGNRRIDNLRVVVAGVQNPENPVAMIAFGGPWGEEVRFVGGVPEPCGGTPLHLAIDLAKEYGATRLVVISDGMPDMNEGSLEAARRFGGRIDVVFVGNPGEPGSFFLDELAKVTGGKRHEGKLEDTKQLTGMVIGLLEGEVEEPKSPIQGPGFTTVDAEDVDEDDDEDEDEDEDDDEDDE